MYFSIISVFIVAISLQPGSTVDLAVSNLLKMQQGLGWPHRLHVAMGHEALLKIPTSEQNVQCEVTSPQGDTFNVMSPPNNRFESWGDGCGVRVQNVSSEDVGRWRLTATGNMNLTGWTELYVEEDINLYTPSPISLLDGQTHAEVELTSLDNSYCLVAQPFAESSLVSGHCRVTLERANRAVQGNWNVLVGLPGKVSELQVQVRVNVEAERLDVGFVHDTSQNKLHIYCNVLHTMKNITFCRFQMATAPYGYTVMDGLSDGRHSYYGDGFLARHCGITIENPTAVDYGSWRCSVGLQQWVGTHIEQQPAMQALVRVLPHTLQIRRQLRVEAETQTVLVEEGASFTLTCYADISLSYCWFQHPNGTQYTPVVHDDSEQEFWYTGTSLKLGECGITFAKARAEDAGQWTCHMGPSDRLGVEMTDEVDLRITGPLAAASVTEVGAGIGGTTTLYCRTANGNKPLHYCRFLSPNRVGISIDSSVTSENAILDRYYFTPDRELNYGDCSLTIDPVATEDIGEWTCAALVDDQIIEARDTITVRQLATRSRAGIIGMSIGGAFLLVILIAVVLYRKGYIKLKRGGIARNSEVVVTASRVRPSNFSSSTTSSQDSEEFRAEIRSRSVQNS
ncbi:uncharacterized protein LOC128669498 [Plodia interpunctella]|uniref:uncharacterized protein LOC128669498 n=1 Tax=Plodia interpunctella TaxID=58824 RepID=UPI0023679752|nr:uncharacterized protein LOC128669498 [Plodia interpunctella]